MATVYVNVWQPQRKYAISFLPHVQLQFAKNVIYIRDYKFHLSQEIFIAVCYHIIKLYRVFFYIFLVYFVLVLSYVNLYYVMFPVLHFLHCKLMFLVVLAMHSEVHCYLTDRTHYVSLYNHWSVFAPVHSYAPQGSILGPMLFTYKFRYMIPQM